MRTAKPRATVSNLCRQQVFAEMRRLEAGLLLMLLVLVPRHAEASGKAYVHVAACRPADIEDRRHGECRESPCSSQYGQRIPHEPRSEGVKGAAPSATKPSLLRWTVLPTVEASAADKLSWNHGDACEDILLLSGCMLP